MERSIQTGYSSLFAFHLFLLTCEYSNLLGGSYLSTGTTDPKGTGEKGKSHKRSRAEEDTINEEESKGVKKDSVAHALQRMKLSFHIDKVVKKAFKVSTVESKCVFFVTRPLTANGKELLLQEVELYDKQRMWDEVWSDKIKNYAESIPLTWLKP